MRQCAITAPQQLRIDATHPRKLSPHTAQMRQLCAKNAPTLRQKSQKLAQKSPQKQKKTLYPTQNHTAPHKIPLHLGHQLC